MGFEWLPPPFFCGAKPIASFITQVIKREHTEADSKPDPSRRAADRSRAVRIPGRLDGAAPHPRCNSSGLPMPPAPAHLGHGRKEASRVGAACAHHFGERIAKPWKPTSRDEASKLGLGVRDTQQSGYEARLHVIVVRRGLANAGNGVSKAVNEPPISGPSPPITSPVGACAAVQANSPSSLARTALVLRRQRRITDAIALIRRPPRATVRRKEAAEP